MKLPRLADRLVGFTLAATALTTTAGFFPRVFWVGELCSHFRLQYAGAALIIGLAAVLRRRPSAAAAAAVVLAANAAVVVAAWSAAVATVEPRGAPRLQLVSLNLEYTNRDFGAVRNYLAARRPDVIVLAELTPEWVAQLGELTREYPYWLTQARNSPWGLGVYSRYPLTAARFVELGLPGSVNVAATLEVPGHPVEFFAVHLSSPTRPWRTSDRNLQLAGLASALQASRAAHEGVPRLVIGDFNVTAFSPYFRELLHSTGMLDVRLPAPWRGTWPVWMPLLQIQIDHCVTDPQLRPVEVARGPATGSDHYPIEVHFEIVG